MSANIDTMLYVGETPWHNLGTYYETPPKTAQEIIDGAKLDWEVEYESVHTEIHGEVPNYYAVFRNDTQDMLAVAKSSYRPRLVQNRDMFNVVEGLIDNEMDTETAASLGHGEQVFGCFKIREQYKVVDDDVDHYFVVVDDHTTVDGKITVIHTPVRVVCQNTLSEALNKNLYHIRIPCTTDTSINSTYSLNLMNGIKDIERMLSKKAEELLKEKVDKTYMIKLMDTMFPYQIVDGIPVDNKANETVSATRSVFESCMEVDNLGNYRGTQYQVYMALTDFTQHYFKKATAAYDLNKRMAKVPGLMANAEASSAAKFLKIRNKIN